MSVQKPEHYGFGEFRIDSGKRLLSRAGQAIALTPKAFDTLLCLVENRGKVMEKDELMTAVWPDTVVEENNLNQNISTLRKVLGESRGENRYIATVPGRGYRFVAEVSTLAADGEEATGERLEGLSGKAGEPSVPGHLWLFLAGALVAVLLAGATYRVLSRHTRQARSLQIRSLAVLPFKPLVPAERDEVLELGMADTLITKLSDMGGLVIRPLALVRRFTDPNQDPAAAGRDLEVDAVLDGSIQDEAGRIRITVRLVRTSDGTQLWSGKYDQRSGDIFAAQDSIGEQVAGELAGQLTTEQQERLRKRYTANTEAYALYLRGNYFWEKRTRDATLKAIDYFEQAIARDPDYALAYAGIANCYTAMPVSSDVPALEVFPKAEAAAVHALEIDGELADAHVSLGYLHFFFDWNWQAARAEYRTALRINPNHPAAHWGYALLLSSLGQHDEANAEMDEAVRLEPLWPMTGALKGHVLFQAHRYPEAISSLEKTLELNDGFWITHIELGKSYEGAGQFDQALKSFQRARELSGDISETVSLTGYTYAVSHRRAEAEKMLGELRAMARQKYVPPYNFALLYHGLGDTKEALAWLERADQEKDVHLVFLGVDPKWDALRDQPQFRDLMKRLDLANGGRDNPVSAK